MNVTEQQRIVDTGFTTAVGLIQNLQRDVLHLREADARDFVAFAEALREDNAALRLALEEATSWIELAASNETREAYQLVGTLRDALAKPVR